MHASDLFGHRDLALPTRRDTDDFRSFVASKFSAFETVISQVSGTDPVSVQITANVQVIRDLCVALLDVVDRYLAGDPGAAFNRLDQALTPLRPHLERLFADVEPTAQLKRFYRARVEDSPLSRREDLFHIPFESRHMVGNQRYSISGLPCLYLGGSTIVCWAELGRPHFDRVQIAAFWLRRDRKIKLVDFGHPPQWLARWIANAAQKFKGNPLDPAATAYLVAHLICWPLMAVSSVVTRNPKGPFKPEYIVPQVLLQWISRQPDFDGIRYFSTHVACVTDNPHWVCNYVFPVKQNASAGRCPHVRGLFKMTEPYAWQLLRAVNLDGTPGSAYEAFDFQFIPNITEDYGHSEFGQIQTRLNTLAIKIDLWNQKVPGGDPLLGDVLP